MAAITVYLSDISRIFSDSDNRITRIKAVRDLTGVGLREVRDFVEFLEDRELTDFIGKSFHTISQEWTMSGDASREDLFEALRTLADILIELRKRGEI